MELSEPALKILQQAKSKVDARLYIIMKMKNPSSSNIEEMNDSLLRIANFVDDECRLKSLDIHIKILIMNQVIKMLS